MYGLIAIANEPLKPYKQNLVQTQNINIITHYEQNIVSYYKCGDSANVWKAYLKNSMHTEIVLKLKVLYEHKTKEDKIK